jgi:thiol-disulfide isomerase/thioredoxin
VKRIGRWVLALALIQAALIGAYLLVEHRRASSRSRALGTEPPRPIDLPLPPLTLERPDGSRFPLRPSGRPTLIHVWATWCPPCRAELPGLLELEARGEVAVVAVALDPRWEDVARFLGDTGGSSEVFLAASPEVERSLGVSDLPVTFLLAETGRLALRFDGARDWTDQAFLRRHLADRAGGR